MNIETSFGFLALFLASYSYKNQNISAMTSVGNTVNANTIFSGKIIKSKIADSASGKRAVDFFVKNKQIVENKFNNIMIENNKEILKKANAAIINGDYEGFLSFCSENTIWTFIGDQTLQGKEAVRQYMAKTYVEPPKFKVDNLIGDGDFVTAVGKISLKDSNGKMTNYLYCDVWRFSEGKMAELKAFVIKTE
jgi:ketosteroid isomerase-like protein